MMPTSGDDGLILNLPVGTYNATFTPDSQSIVYASTTGLGFGSELGILNLSDGNLVLWQQLQDQVFAFPRWSPDGTQLTYILIPDNNTPYTVGELWLADVNGKPLMLLDEVDAGHGYSPIWNPDSNALVYIRRENPASLQADYRAEALHSNLYQINLETYEITPLTQFTNTLVYDAVWSPDGSQLTFTAADTIWLLEPNHAPIQISSSGISRHSTWISLPNP